MKLKVNDSPVDITLENEKTVGDFLKSFEEAIEKEDATTTGIVLNGKSVSAEDIDDIQKEPLEDDTSIELTVISKAQILDSFGDSARTLTALNENMGEISVLIQSGKDGEAFAIINTLADEMAKFVRVARLSVLFPDLYEKITMDGKDLSDFFEDFYGILKDFEQALSEKDTVTVGDLAEYEISPRLQQIIDSLNGCCR
ncbi:MAG: hypothetical protein II584_05010 [Treponema sp.]|nr:hypothetical protein [Treponema sp.]MBQ2601727.1 hypothetical protein [Treponema sp.]